MVYHTDFHSHTSLPGGGWVLQHLLHSIQEGRGSLAHPQPEKVQQLHRERKVHNVDLTLGDTVIDHQSMVGQSGSQECLFPCPNSSVRQEIPEIQLEMTVLPVPIITVRPVFCAKNLHQGSAPSHGLAQDERSPVVRLPGRHSCRGKLSPGSNLLSSIDQAGSDQSRIYPKHKEVRPHTYPKPCVHWGPLSNRPGDGVSSGRPDACTTSVCPDISSGRRLPDFPPVVAAPRHHGFHASSGRVCSPLHAPNSAAPKGKVECSAGSVPSSHGDNDCSESNPMVDKGGKPQTGITSFTTSSFPNGPWM